MNSSRWRCIAFAIGPLDRRPLAGKLVGLVAVDADDHLLARLDTLLEAHRRGADHALHEARLDRAVHAAGVVDDAS